MKTKPFYKSRTLIFNVLSLSVAVATVLTNPGLIADPNVVLVAAGVLTVGNAVLRLETSLPIDGSPAAG